MNVKLRQFASTTINSLLFVFDLKLVQRGRDQADFISFRKTLAGAKEAGLPVGDYIDAKHNVPGATQETLDQMAKLGVFDKRIERVCEIGPGSGRYLEKTVQACNPDYYQIYETASDWRKWLVQKYKVTAQPTDGVSLSHTPSCSIDLVQAHKVFSWIPFLTTCRYFGEMERVVRDGGKVVFDIVTEECMDDANLESWLATGIDWPGSMVSKQFAIDFFCQRGLSLAGTFFITMKPGITQYLVFTK